MKKVSFVVLAVLVTAAVAQAGTWSYDFNNLSAGNWDTGIAVGDGWTQKGTSNGGTAAETYLRGPDSSMALVGAAKYNNYTYYRDISASLGDLAQATTITYRVSMDFDWGAGVHFGAYSSTGTPLMTIQVNRGGGNPAAMAIWDGVRHAGTATPATTWKTYELVVDVASMTASLYEDGAIKGGLENVAVSGDPTAWTHVGFFLEGADFTNVTNRVAIDNLYVEATLPVPEPATMSLLALGGLAAIIRRRRK